MIGATNSFAILANTVNPYAVAPPMKWAEVQADTMCVV